MTTSSFVPTKPIEFHWYSAEEGGLLGSQKVVEKYVEDNIPVVAMYQIDMTGYVTPNKKEVIGISNDFVDPAYTVNL